jgi:BirA family biotin operon repressor/biotin-[acetyl-CoA-carboxylase] ligase
VKNELINIFKKNNDYLSGEVLSKNFSLSRASIWKSIEELRKEGYVIKAVPHLGYKLESIPDRLLEREISYQLNTEIIGKKIFSFESIESTMDYAFGLGVKGESEGTIVLGETQTKGRGRLGRTWESPKYEGIYASIVLRPKMAIVDVAKLNLLIAVSVCEAINKAAKVATTIKWPNDLLIGGKKVAGFLTEMSAEMDRLNFVVIGMGINVNNLENALLPNATSLKEHSEKKLSRIKILQEILRSTEHWYDIVQAQGFDPIVTRWKELSSTLGRRVRLSDQSGDLEGEAIDIDQYGGLMIKNDDGVLIKRMSGDVVEV